MGEAEKTPDVLLDELFHRLAEERARDRDEETPLLRACWAEYKKNGLEES